MLTQQCWLVGWSTALQSNGHEVKHLGCWCCKPFPMTTPPGHLTKQCLLCSLGHNSTVVSHIMEAKGCGVSSPARLARTLTAHMHTFQHLNLLLLLLLLLGFVQRLHKASQSKSLDRDVIEWDQFSGLDPSIKRLRCLCLSHSSSFLFISSFLHVSISASQHLLLLSFSFFLSFFLSINSLEPIERRNGKK